MFSHAIPTDILGDFCKILAQNFISIKEYFTLRICETLHICSEYHFAKKFNSKAIGHLEKTADKHKVEP